MAHIQNSITGKVENRDRVPNPEKKPGTETAQIPPGIDDETVFDPGSKSKGEGPIVDRS